MLLYNLTESSLLTQHSIWWVLYTSTAVSLFPASAQMDNDYELQPNCDRVSAYAAVPL
jgi:hypothetical protein